MLSARLATAADRPRLEQFVCSRGEWFTQEVQDEIQHSLLDRIADQADLRVLLLEDDDGTLVGVAAHGPNWRIAVEDVVPPGTELVVLALSLESQGTRQPDGVPTVVRAIELLLEDVRAQARGPLTGMFIAQDNEKMIDVWRRFAAFVEVISHEGRYRCLVGHDL